MTLPPFKMAEINPFIEGFKAELQQRIDQAVNSFTARGLGQSGTLCEENISRFIKKSYR